MKVTDHETYQKFEPTEGSRLHRLIKADVEAINALAQVEEAIEDIDRRIAEAGRVIDAIAWDGSNFAEAREAILDREALGVMAEQAAEERQRRINARLATERALEHAANPLEHYGGQVAKHERNMRDVPGRVTDRDKEKAEKAAEMLADARERLLQPA